MSRGLQGERSFYVKRGNVGANRGKTGRQVGKVGQCYIFKKTLSVLSFFNNKDYSVQKNTRGEVNTCQIHIPRWILNPTMLLEGHFPLANPVYLLISDTILSTV